MQGWIITKCEPVGELEVEGGYVWREGCRSRIVGEKKGSINKIVIKRKSKCISAS